MSAQLIEECTVIPLHAEPAPLAESLEGLAVAADALRASVDALRASGALVPPELQMFTERAQKAAEAAQAYRAKHYPRESRLGF